MEIELTKEQSEEVKDVFGFLDMLDIALPSDYEIDFNFESKEANFTFLENSIVGDKKLLLFKTIDINYGARRVEIKVSGSVEDGKKTCSYCNKWIATHEENSDRVAIASFLEGDGMLFSTDDDAEASESFYMGLEEYPVDSNFDLMKIGKMYFTDPIQPVVLEDNRQYIYH